MLPFIPVSDTSVRIQNAGGVVGLKWKAEEGPSLHKVVFKYQGARKQGMIESLVVDMSEVGKIYVTLQFYGPFDDSMPFKIFDALQSPIDADPQRITMRHVNAALAKASHVEQQLGLEILEDENLEQLVKVTHMMLFQRMLVGMKVAVP